MPYKGEIEDVRAGDTGQVRVHDTWTDWVTVGQALAQAKLFELIKHNPDKYRVVRYGEPTVIYSRNEDEG